MSFSIFSAQIFGVLGLLGISVFIIGGKKDNDGQGTNPSIKKDWEVDPQKAIE